MRLRLALALSLSLATPLAAQSREEAAELNMRLALDVCLRHNQVPSQIPDALSDLGFAVVAGRPAGRWSFTLIDQSAHTSWEFYALGMYGYLGVRPQEGAQCVVATPLLPHARARIIARLATDYLFGSLANDRAPQAADDCNMIELKDRGNYLNMELLTPDNRNRCGPGSGAAINLMM